MSLRVTVFGTLFDLVLDRVDETDQRIVCSIPGSPIEFVDISYPLAVEDTFDPDNFRIYPLVNKSLVENDIFQVYDTTRNQRMGWCLPLEALNSTEHSYANNEHFLRYAYVAALKLLNTSFENAITLNPTVESAHTLSFSEFFPDSTALLVISLDTLVNPDGFNIDDWIPALYLYGYVPLKTRNPEYLCLTGKVEKNCRLNLQPISNHLPRQSFVESVFADLLAFERNPLLRFFYLYQVVELLLEEVFRCEQSLLVDRLLDTSGDALKTKEILETVSDISREKERLKLLTTKYLKRAPSCERLKHACDSFLAACGKETPEHPMYSFYKVRNILFHQYRDVRGDLPLEEVVFETTPFLVNILQEFTIGTNPT